MPACLRFTRPFVHARALSTRASPARPAVDLPARGADHGRGAACYAPGRDRRRCSAVYHLGVKCAGRCGAPGGPAPRAGRPRRGRSLKMGSRPGAAVEDWIDTGWRPRLLMGVSWLGGPHRQPRRALLSDRFGADLAAAVRGKAASWPPPAERSRWSPTAMSRCARGRPWAPCSAMRPCGYGAGRRGVRSRWPNSAASWIFSRARGSTGPPRCSRWAAA